MSSICSSKFVNLRETAPPAVTVKSSEENDATPTVEAVATSPETVTVFVAGSTTVEIPELPAYVKVSVKRLIVSVPESPAIPRFVATSANVVVPEPFVTITCPAEPSTDGRS